LSFGNVWPDLTAGHQAIAMALLSPSHVEQFFSNRLLLARVADEFAVLAAPERDSGPRPFFQPSLAGYDRAQPRRRRRRIMILLGVVFVRAFNRRNHAEYIGSGHEPRQLVLGRQTKLTVRGEEQDRRAIDADEDVPILGLSGGEDPSALEAGTFDHYAAVLEALLSPCRSQDARHALVAYLAASARIASAIGRSAFPCALGRFISTDRLPLGLVRDKGTVVAAAVAERPLASVRLTQ
jgi:hypothetical protein